jgi:outer membrane murein-binding lipoprotein Lpp
MWILRTVLIGALALGLLVFAGCSKSEPRKAGPPPEKQQEYTLSKCIELGSSGKQAEAVDQFTGLDWSKGLLFSSGDSLGFSEQQIAALPEGDRAQLVKKVASLKALGVHVSQLAQKAEAARNGEQAEKYAGSVSRCGEALDQPQYCTMLRQVGKAFKKLGK